MYRCVCSNVDCVSVFGCLRKITGEIKKNCVGICYYTRASHSAQHKRCMFKLLYTYKISCDDDTHPCIKCFSLANTKDYFFLLSKASHLFFFCFFAHVFCRCRKKPFLWPIFFSFVLYGGFFCVIVLFVFFLWIFFLQIAHVIFHMSFLFFFFPFRSFLFFFTFERSFCVIVVAEERIHEKRLVRQIFFIWFFSCLVSPCFPSSRTYII